ncbi:thioredoxin [Haloplanus rubicundus]|uniref:Thioredoxin n=1 Tax=Haloplanus rubicundus TaxID=1547898 RepID=A0A345EFI2_9EURY|nr:thioredoxin family protein [Haloplanus rubicundus]AXG07538.1 thioredoxin [Haloplanus rubicundus]AXG10954.1 thioredoxin [Haloplanus rubicundus]
MQGTDAKPIRVETAAELDALIDAHDRLLVELFTEGCGACAAMEPVLGVVARETGVPVALVNPRDDPVLIERFDVRSVPTLVRFEDGEAVDRLAEGFVGADRVIEFLR